jgi:DNA-binding NarL/FixJ family response regulator
VSDVDGGRLRRSLDALLDDEASPSADDALGLALNAFVATWRLEHAATTQLARRAAVAADDDTDPATLVLVRAVLALGAAGNGIAGGWRSTARGYTPSGDPLADALPLLDRLDDSDLAHFARYALAEAALACARVGLAAQISPPTAFGGALAGHRFETVMVVLAARTAAFSGQIDVARRVLATHVDDPHNRLGLLATATRALIEGNAAHPASVRAIRDGIEQRAGVRHDRMDSGIVILASYGLIAIGDVAQSAALLAGTDWDRAMIIDRAIVSELLVNAAILEGDLVASEAWLASAERFDGSPIADSALDRARSRVSLQIGDAAGAIAYAERAIRRSIEEGRAIETAEAEILAARARIAAGRRGEAARHLEAAAAGASASGHLSIRRAAARELRGTGRRLRPDVGSGGAGLSPRERDVLALLLEGLDNPAIAEHLHISPHTARMHVSRILAAYGAPSRLTLARRVAAESADPAAGAAAYAELTPRQRAVVAEAVGGATNADIADRLGIATRTVEKHVSDAMQRWGVTTRVGLVVRAAGLDRAAGPMPQGR